jgi:ornithine carbamoyltransferase
LLAGKTLAMIFEKPSTRTRISFEVGMWQLGGAALFLSSQELQMGRGEPVKDTAAVLSRYVNGIMIRTFDHATVQELARYASVPVVNGLTDLLHPCQVLADLLTIEEKKGHLQGVKIAYTGDGNNVAHSLLLGCSKMGLDLAVATPPSYRPLPKIVAEALANAGQSGSKIFITDDPSEAVKNADVIYTDVWTSMGQEKEKAERRTIFAPYQINSNLVKMASPDVLIMHCLPAYRGEEITTQVLEGERSVVLDQAENRLHAQKALLALLMGTAKG